MQAILVREVTVDPEGPPEAFLDKVAREALAPSIDVLKREQHNDKNSHGSYFSLTHPHLGSAGALGRGNKGGNDGYWAKPPTT